MNILTQKLLILTAFLASTLAVGNPKVSASTSEVCKPIDLQGFQSYLNNKNISSVIFFASWCLQCKPHLIHAKKGSVAIGIFDTRPRLDAAFSSFAPKDVDCFFDLTEEIAKFYKTESLPKIIELEK